MQLTDEQKAILADVRAAILGRYKGRKAPPTEHLEREANELIQTLVARARGRGETVESLRVLVEHDGGGYYRITPLPRMELVEISLVVGSERRTL